MRSNLENRPIVFVHIPKTGGSSLSNFMYEHIPEVDRLYVEGWKQVLNVSTDQINSAKYIHGHFSVAIEEYISNTPVFMAFLREPVRIVVSYYNYAKSRPDHPLHEFASAMPFEEFIENRKCLRVHGMMTKQLGNNQKLNAAYHKIDFSECDEHDKQTLLENAKKRLNDIQLLGITEHMQLSFAYICYLLDWEWDGIIPRQNQTTSPDKLTVEDLSENTLQRVIELNQTDIELYEYGIDVFFQRIMDLSDNTQTIPDMFSFTEFVKLCKKRYTHKKTEIEHLMEAINRTSMIQDQNNELHKSMESIAIVNRDHDQPRIVELQQKLNHANHTIEKLQQELNQRQLDLQAITQQHDYQQSLAQEANKKVSTLTNQLREQMNRLTAKQEALDQTKTQLNTSLQHNDELAQQVNDPPFLQGIYRSVLPLKYRLQLKRLRNR